MSNRKQKRSTKDLKNDSEEIKKISNSQFKLGDLTWFKLRDSVWWPAKVVDEENVSKKPRKKSNDEILCRLYGSPEYVYVDALKSKSEFEDVLKRENKSMSEKFQQVVEQEISLMKLRSKSKRKTSKSKDVNSPEASNGKKNDSKQTPKPTEKASAVSEKKDSIKGKRKLDWSEENKQVTNPNSKSPKEKTLNLSKKHKVINQEPSNEKNEEKMNAFNASNEKNEEEIKAKDLEIRKKVRDILYGDILTQKKEEIIETSPKNNPNGKLKSIKKKEDLKSNGDEKMIQSGKKERKEKKMEAKNSSKNVEETNSPLLSVQAEEKGSLSARKIRVMQNLALIAPVGSPFRN